VTEEEEEVVTPTEEEVVTEEEEVVTPTEEEVVTPTEEVPTYGGWVTVALTSAITNFDDAWASSSACLTLALSNEHLISGDWARGAAGTGEYDFLYGSYPLNPIGAVIESWEFPDPDTIILHVKKGEDAVHWALNPDSTASRLAGGREVTAEDIADSITRQFTLPTAWGYRSYYSWWYPGGSATATDNCTVVVKGHDYPLGTVNTWQTISAWLYILPYDVIEKYGDMQDWQNSVGTGPFMLTDYLPGSYATFVRNPNYWMKDPCGAGKGNQLPYLDGVNLLTVLDFSTRIAALRTGKLDLLNMSTQIDREDFEPLIKANPEMQYVRILNHGGQVFFRVDEKPFDDINVRRALSMAIDYQTIKDTYYGGEAEILTWPSAPIPGYMDAYTPLEELPESTRELFEYKPEKAEQLLDEAGYPGPNRLTFSCLCSSEETVDLLSIVKNDLAKIGVTLNIDVRTSAVYTSMQAAKSFHGAISAVALSNVLRTSLKVPEIQCGQGRNAGFCDQYVEDLFTEIWAFENIGKNDLQQQWKKDLTLYVLPLAVMIQLPGPYQYRMWWPWVKNYHGEDLVSYTGRNDSVKFIWIDQDLKEEITGRR
jgi:peptide/nickel transport system substrate-binding protein